MKKARGYLIILTLLVMGALLFLAVVFMNFYSSEQDLALRAQQNIIAEGAAGAAVDAAIYELESDSAWEAGFDRVTLPHSQAVYSLTFNKDQTALPYSTNNLKGATQVTGWQGRIVPAHCAHLIGIGYMGFMKQFEQAMITIGNTPFVNAAMVVDNLSLSGNVTIDSYNSANGTYDQTHQNSGANIGTGSGDPGVINLNGNVEIYGQVFAGPGGSEAGSINQNGNVSYQTFAIDQPAATPFLTPPTGTNLGPVSANGNQEINLAPGIYSDLTVNGHSTINFSAGTYVFTGNISISGSSTLNLPTGSGAVTVYAMENIDFSGNSNINNETEIPQNFVIIGGPDTQSVAFGGGIDAYLGIYAPAATVAISGNSEIFGSVVGKNLFMSGSSQVHFDQSLKTLSIGSGGTVSVRGRW